MPTHLNARVSGRTMAAAHKFFKTKTCSGDTPAEYPSFTKIGSADAAKIAAVSHTVTAASPLRIEELNDFTLAQISQPETV